MQEFVGKGQHKGKGKSLTKGLRSHTPSSGSLTTGKGSHGKGSTSTPSKGKTPLPGKGKGDKGKGARQGPPFSNVSRLQCKFCHLHGHIEQHCRKRHALQNSGAYQQARSTFNSRQQLLIDQLEDNLFGPNVCSWCLTCACTPESCYPPEDPDFYTEVTHLFQTTLLPFVQNAKLGLPIDNSAPLMPHHFAFEGTEWGQQYDQVSHEEYQEGDNSAPQTFDEFSESNKNQYMFDFCDATDVNNEQAHEQIEQFLHMCAEADEEHNNICSLGSVEEDYDLYNMEESDEFNQ